MYGLIQSLIIVPNRRRIGLVNVLNKYCVGGKNAMGEGGQGGEGGFQMEQLALSKRPARMVIRCHVQRADIPSKGSSFIL
jgi:hypothetical protein